MDYSSYKQLEFRRKFWKFFGAQISVFDPVSDRLVGFIKMKAWKLREDVRLYTDQTMQQEVIRIGARQILDFGATYDIFDSATNQKIVALQRKGLKSTFVRDYWKILDGQGNLYGYVQETSGTLALVRRWVGLILGDLGELIFAFTPQTYNVMYAPNGQNPQLAAKLTHRKNPFIVKMGLDTSQAQVALDSRITIAVASLLSIIDAAKNS